MKTDPKKLAKLPQWARFLIEKLEDDLEGSEKTVASLVPDGPETSEVGLQTLSGCTPAFRPLPCDSVVIFRLGKNFEVEARVGEWADGPRLELRGNNRNGSGRLAITVGSSNNIEVIPAPGERR